jgi:prolyl 4-hydroxylase
MTKLKLLFFLTGMLIRSRAALAAVEGDTECIVVGGDEESSCLNEDLLVMPSNGIFPNDWAGMDQKVEGPQWKTTLIQIYKTKHYMAKAQQDENLPREVMKECQDRNEMCQFWASIGECEANPSYMRLQCAPACQSCHLLSFETRCPFDKDAPSIWKAGDLNAMFERITSAPYYVEKYSPKILSGPKEEKPGPWVVVLENFATPEDCERMIQLGADRGYEQSQDVGEKKFDGTYDGKISKGRTSSNTWCLDECWTDDASARIHDVMENITGIPRENYEYLQLLQYQVGQFYNEHHDFIEFHRNRPQHVRALTVFLYLNTVPKGGGTHFNDLNITVEAKQGRAVVWPSVYDSNPTKKDPRTHHEALAVEEGIKYGANAWVHLVSSLKWRETAFC